MTGAASLLGAATAALSAIAPKPNGESATAKRAGTAKKIV